MEEDVSCGGGGEAEVAVGSEGMKREFGDGDGGRGLGSEVDGDVGRQP